VKLMPIVSLADGGFSVKKGRGDAPMCQAKVVLKYPRAEAGSGPAQSRSPSGGEASPEA